MRFKFIKMRNLDNHFDTTEVEVRSCSESLSDLCEDFHSFLAACGYQVQNMYVDIIPYEGYSEDEEE